MNINVITMNVPDFFHLLPNEIQDLIFEFNIEYRVIMKNVLNQLINYIYCKNCSQLISPSLLNKVCYCSSECMDEMWNNYINNR